MHAKKVLIPFLLLLALVPLCACTATVPTPGVPLPQLVIGSDNYPPYNYTDENGFPAGVDVALAREACRRIGYEPVFRLIDWDQKDEFLQNGEVDCLWGCFSMNNREESYLWAGPYACSRQVVAVRQDSDIQSLGDLAGHAAALTAQLQYTNTPYRLLEESLLRSEVGVAFAREGDTALRDRLHTALVEMFADGTIEKILAEYGLDPADALGGTAGE